MENVFSGGK